MKTTSLKERIKVVADYYKISVRELERRAGLNPGVLSSMAVNLGSDKVGKILIKCLEINPLWLLTGEGEMVLHNTQAVPLRKEEYSKLEEPVISDKKYIAGLEEQNRQLKQQLEVQNEQVKALLKLLASTTQAKTTENK